MGDCVRLLLIEDDLPTAKLLQYQLAAYECELHHAVTFGEGLAYVRDHSRDIDIVVSDLRLPDSTAQDTVKQLGRLTADVPVVVLTGMEDDDLGHAAIRHGAEDFIAKSADPQTLRRSIHYAIARHRLKRDLRSVVEGNADAVVVVDAGNQVRYVNNAAEKLFESPSPAWVGKSFGYPVPSRSAVLVDLERKDDVRTVEIRTTDIRWEEDDCLLLSVRDVTDRMRAQELERQLLHADRLAAIGQLAAGVAHEINNPATFVSSNVQRLEECIGALRGIGEVTPIVDEMADLLRDTKLGLERIVSCARGLNVFSRARGSEMEVGDVTKVVEEACALTRSELRHHANLIVGLDEVPPVEMDRGAIAQVVVNLLINAAQAIHLAPPSRGHEVVVTTRWDVEEGEVVIAVEDSGCGIPEEIVSSVFDPFFTTKDEGTGLGLSICADVIHKHRGRIEVRSRLGIGTKFEVRLPVCSAPAPTLPTDPAPASLSSKRILLVDDDHLVRRAIMRGLRGHDVVDVASADEGLAALAAKPAFDAILCDIMMPDKDGVAFYEEVSARFPEYQSRLVFVSGGAFTRRVSSFLEQSEVPVIDKPTTAEALASALARLKRRVEVDGE